MSLIVAVCSLFMVWEWVSKPLGKPTITDLSHRWPWSLVVWGWWALLGLHFLYEARKK